MKIQPKPTPAPTPTPSPRACADSRPDANVPPASPPTAAALPPAPTLPPHVWRNRTFAEMPDRNSPEWGTRKPQLTVKTDAGELAKIPKHPARMTEGELMERYFDPGYKFDTATGNSAEPFFTKPGSLVESPTHLKPGPWDLPTIPAPVQATPGLWGGAPIAQSPKAEPIQPTPGLWGGATLTQEPITPTRIPEAVRPAPGLWSGGSPTPAPISPADMAAPLLPNERTAPPESPPQTDRFAGFEGWGRNAGGGGRNDYHGSDWD